MDSINLKIVLILTFGFGFASILGYFSQKIKLSPILGYLLAGYLIGPFSPGFNADLEIAEQLAEIGVILMLFSVGLHFRWQDLLSQLHIALPGALIQTIVATLVGTILIYSIGWSVEAGIIFGLAIGVASTVVLVRVLGDNHKLNTPAGHIAVGWLIVEDIITIVALLLIPSLAVSMSGQEFPLQATMISFGIILVEFALLCIFMFTLGRKIVSFIFSKILLTNSHELFTLTILAITFAVAVGSAVLLGTSMALGAFIAGMIIGQTNMRQKVSSNTLPLKDVFVVIFFLSIGMLFDPHTLEKDFMLFIAVLGIILIIKPLVAFLITIILKYPFSTALTIAIGLAQIGEFSFILAEQATKFKILPDEGYDILVACSLVSISINPLLFKLFT